jgi:hypothetical protein
VTTEQTRHIEFVVLSYVPQVVAGDKYDVGLLVLERSDGRTRLVAARFIPDTKGLLAFDPNADVKWLLAFFRDIEQCLKDPEDADVFLQMMQDTFSNTVQISDPKTVIVHGDPIDEIDQLAALYVYRH